MNKIEIRLHAGVSSSDDLVVTVQDATYDYLLSSPAPEIRISAYLDRDWPVVQKAYAEVFVHADCAFETRIKQIIPGSKLREGITLPGPMKNGEQLVLVVTRSPLKLD